MPIITDIKQLKRSKGRFSVHIDGKYAFSVDGLELSARGLAVGEELSQDEIDGLRDRAGEDKAYGMALSFVAIRPRSRREISDYLTRKGIEGETTEEVLGRLKQLGLVDDRAFASAWIASRQAGRPRSRRQLEQELAAKGVSSQDIAIVLEGEFGGESERASLVSVISKKRRLPQYRDQAKLTSYLIRQGFAYELVKEALSLLNDDTDPGEVGN